MCSDELLALLSQCASAASDLAHDKDVLHLAVLEQMHHDALYHIAEESEECLGTDRTLQRLEDLFRTSAEAIPLFYQNQAWAEINDLAVELLVVHQELSSALDEVTA